MIALSIGIMQTPDTGYSRDTVAQFGIWAADNGCYSAKWKPERWQRFLKTWADMPGCMFAVVPDVVGNAAATRARWDQWAPFVRSLGYSTAYVLQDGETGSTIPDDADWLFIGGSTDYKLSQAVAAICAATTKPVHMGRVNTIRRARYAAAIGCHSADGTLLAFGADANIRRAAAMVNASQQTAMLTALT